MIASLKFACLSKIRNAIYLISACFQTVKIKLCAIIYLFRKQGEVIRSGISLLDGCRNRVGCRIIVDL